MLGEIRLAEQLGSYARPLLRGHICEAEWLGHYCEAEWLGHYCEAEWLSEIRLAEQHHITEIITATQHRCFSFT